MIVAIVVLWMNLKQFYLKRFRCLIYCFLSIDLSVLVSLNMIFFPFKRQKAQKLHLEIPSFESYMSQFFTLNL